MLLVFVIIEKGVLVVMLLSAVAWSTCIHTDSKICTFDCCVHPFGGGAFLHDTWNIYSKF